MKKILLVIFILPLICYSQNKDRDYFTYLKDFGKGIYALPNSKSATKITDIENNFSEPIVIAKVNKNSDTKYLVCFTPGPSADPGFEFYSIIGNSYNYLFMLSGTEIFIPGNGYLYTRGHTNNMFDKHKKYKFNEDYPEEFTQPFYYVGLETKTTGTIQLYSDYQCTKKLAILPKGSNIKVVAAEFEKSCKKFLIKTPFGLFGWWKLDRSYPFSKKIDKLFYAGD